MVKILNVKKVNRKLQKLGKRYGKPVSVSVGYKAAYALYVHENTAMVLKGTPRPKIRGRYRGNYWDPKGATSKFLEIPLRRDKNQLVQIVERALEGGATMEQALILAGLFLQRESQMLVPVDTGNLKASAFTEVDKGKSV